MPVTVPDACHYTIEGQPDGPTLVFIHGWPDDASLWRHQLTALGDAYRCVMITLPNFGAGHELRGGCDFPALLAMLGRSLDAALRPGERATLITHDWGSYIAYLFEQAHPERIERMVALDVGGHAEPEKWWQAAFLAGYQWTLILLWWIGGLIPPLGNWLTRQFARLLKVPAERRPAIRSRFNYPYFYLWRGLLCKRWRGDILQRYRPSCPVLYLWGEAKPFHFHSERWLEMVEASGGRYKDIEGAWHWLQLSHASEINAEIRAFLPEPRAAPRDDLLP